MHIVPCTPSREYHITGSMRHSSFHYRRSSFLVLQRHVCNTSCWFQCLFPILILTRPRNIYLSRFIMTYDIFSLLFVFLPPYDPGILLTHLISGSLRRQLIDRLLIPRSRGLVGWLNATEILAVRLLPSRCSFGEINSWQPLWILINFTVGTWLWLWAAIQPVSGFVMLQKISSAWQIQC